MEEKNNIDKYTKKILKHIDLVKPPIDFTENIMDVILFEQTDKIPMETFGSKKFLLLFSVVFSSIVLLAFFWSSGESDLPIGYNAAKDMLNHFQIDFSLSSIPIFSIIKDMAVLKILPWAVIALIIFERLLLKYSDSWKA